jgi:hypothetical protein
LAAEEEGPAPSATSETNSQGQPNPAKRALLAHWRAIKPQSGCKNTGMITDSPTASAATIRQAHLLQPASGTIGSRCFVAP